MAALGSRVYPDVSHPCSALYNAALAPGVLELPLPTARLTTSHPLPPFCPLGVFALVFLLFS